MCSQQWEMFLRVSLKGEIKRKVQQLLKAEAKQTADEVCLNNEMKIIETSLNCSQK